jgi:signal transduction histidine kinase
VLVSAVWGLWLGMATVAISTIALDYFFLPPVGSLTLHKPEDWTVLAIFLAVTLLAAGLISQLIRSLATEVDARAEADLFTDEQVALRRLATLVAHGAAPEEIFAAVARELGHILRVRHTAVMRYEPDATMTKVGGWNSGRVANLPLGSRQPLEKGTISELVARTKEPERIDYMQAAIGTVYAGPLLTMHRDMGVNSVVGCPITVDGCPWGAVVAGSASGRLPEDTEKRMLDFTDLLATAIANADSQAKLKASRARVLAAADATRRLIERDLHDGTQQRLVALLLELRTTEAAVPPELEELMSHTTQTLDEAIEDLRGIARGLHPALLSRRGLKPAIKALARCSPIPVELNVCADRLAERYEVTTHHLVSEALTNAAKHADASSVQVNLTVEHGAIRLRIRDDGKGGADPDRGEGLLHITDRVEALGGRLQITSPVGGGTSLLAEIPIAGE